MKMEGEIHMTRKDFIRVTACAAVFGIVGGASFQGVNYLYSHTVGSSVIEGAKESLPQTVTYRKEKKKERKMYIV